MTQCEACRINTATTDTYMCSECQTDLLTLFSHLPADIDALQAIADKTAHIGNREHGAKAPFPASPVNWDADTHLHNLKTWLQTTDSDISAGRGLQGPEHWQWHWNNINADRNEWLRLASTPSRYDQLKQLTRHTNRILAHDTYQFAGTCTNCGKPVYAPASRSEAYCRCGNIINVESNRAIARSQLMQMHLTTTPAGAAQWVKDQTGIDVKRNTILKRIKRGTMHAQPQGDGYYRFPINELIAIANSKQEPNRQ